MIYLAIILSVLNTAALVYFVFVRPQNGSAQQNEDQKISKALQLLQSKIAVLEDLSDQVDNQVQQVTILLEGKYRELQNYMGDADKRVVEIQQHLVKGQEVSKLFRDKIPHEEMLQRRNLVKYVKAAKMANAGSTLEEISAAVELPVSELQMIAKVNKNELMFSDESLPEWVKDELQSLPENKVAEEPLVMENLFSRENPLQMNTKAQAAPDEKKALKQLGEQFKRAIVPPSAPAAKGEVRPYEFKKISGNFLE